MTETKGPAGLVKKLAAVALALERIPKNGYNKAQDYKYAEHADVMEAIRKELASRNVVILPKVTDVSFRQIQGGQGKPISIATVRMSFTACDGDSGEMWEVATSVGEGMDYGDKNVPKAMTGAQKSAMLKLFLCATGDDPEKSDELDRDAAAPPPRAPSGQSKPAPAARPPPPPQQRPTGDEPTNFPNYGKAKGAAIVGAALKDLEFYANGCRKSLADASKSKWHGKEQALLNAIMAEIHRQNGGGRANLTADGNDPVDYDGPPPPGDDDAPF